MQKKKLYRLNAKIVVMILVITFVVALVTGGMLYRIFRDAMVERVQKDNQVGFDQLVRDVDAIYEEAVRYGQQLSIDSSIQKRLTTQEYPSAVEELKANRECADELGRMQMLSQSIYSFALVRQQEVLIWTDVPFWDETSRALCQQWYQAFTGAAADFREDRQTISAPYSFAFTFRQGEWRRNFISISVPIFSMNQADECIGSLMINVETASIAEVLDSGKASFDGLAYDSGGTALYATIQNEGQLESLQKAVLAMDGTQEPSGQLTYCSITKLGGSLAGVLALPDFFRDDRDHLWSLLAAVLAAVLLVMLLLIPMMLRLMRPVGTLTSAMKRVGAGDMCTRVDIHTNDEFEILGHELNQMVSRLDEYIQKTLQHEKDRHDLEYEVLVAQINPHFVYNTLNTVIYLAEKGQNEDVVHITKALIDLLQDGIKLSSNKNFSTVEEEIWIIQNYVCIQNYRYQDQFDLEVVCPESLAKQQVPSSVIQPLVENALFHGIVPLQRKGTIVLELAKEERENGDWISICISDNGVGIPEEKINAIVNGTLKLTEASRNHVGVQNIINRLSLLYGDEYQLKIHSQEGVGTRVEILFPV